MGVQEKKIIPRKKGTTINAYIARWKILFCIMPVEDDFREYDTSLTAISRKRKLDTTSAINCANSSSANSSSASSSSANSSSASSSSANSCSASSSTNNDSTAISATFNTCFFYASTFNPLSNSVSLINSFLVII